VHLAGRCSAAFAGAMALTNDGCTIRMHGDPDPGEVDRQEGPAVLAGKDATGLDRLPVPPIEPEDPVGFRDRVPAFDVGQLAAMGLTRPDMVPLNLSAIPSVCERRLASWLPGLLGQGASFAPPERKWKS
jgi:hypothetical protein